jgi:hypothetical protein
VSDEWKPFGGLTFNLGVRYDIQTGVWDEHHTQAEYPRPLPYVDFGSRGDKNNIGPRAGIAWDVKRDGRLVVRGGYGLRLHECDQRDSGHRDYGAQAETASSSTTRAIPIRTRDVIRRRSPRRRRQTSTS